jgi:hypothetical protein
LCKELQGVALGIAEVEELQVFSDLSVGNDEPAVECVRVIDILIRDRIEMFGCGWNVDYLLDITLERSQHFSPRRSMSDGDNFEGWKEFGSSPSASACEELNRRFPHDDFNTSHFDV